MSCQNIYPCIYTLAYIPLSLRELTFYKIFLPLECDPWAYTGLMPKSSQLIPSITGADKVVGSSTIGARSGGSQLWPTSQCASRNTTTSPIERKNNEIWLGLIQEIEHWRRPKSEEDQ